MGRFAITWQKVWKIPDIFLYLHCLKISVMRTVQDYIAIIRQNSSKITKDFGIKTLRIFGSVSRNEQTEQSDLDVCVETETPNPLPSSIPTSFCVGGTMRPER